MTVEVAHSGPEEPSRVLRADAIRLVYGADESVSTEPVSRFAEFSLGPNYPNPASATTSFEYVTWVITH